MNQEELLATRYGRKAKTSKRDRVVAVAIAAVALIAFLVWAIAVASTSTAKPTGNLLSYSVESPSLVDVELHVDNQGGRDTVCQVEALANDYEVVGYKEVPVPKGEKSVKNSLITVRPAVSAVVKDCWFK